jgi:hypothetical protein
MNLFQNITSESMNASNITKVIIARYYDNVILYCFDDGTRWEKLDEITGNNNYVDVNSSSNYRYNHLIISNIKFSHAGTYYSVRNGTIIQAIKLIVWIDKIVSVPHYRLGFETQYIVWISSNGFTAKSSEIYSGKPRSLMESLLNKVDSEIYAVLSYRMSALVDLGLYTVFIQKCNDPLPQYFPKPDTPCPTLSVIKSKTIQSDLVFYVSTAAWTFVYCLQYVVIAYLCRKLRQKKALITELRERQNLI